MTVGFICKEKDVVAFSLYTRLDTDDQAEIRGEMKAMLFREKYQKDSTGKIFYQKNGVPK